MKKNTAVVLTFLCAAALLSACGKGKPAEASLPLEPAEAEAASEADLSFQLRFDGKSYSVESCNKDISGDLVIPATYNGKPVTGIGQSAFASCTGLTGVTIPSSVTDIGFYAFNGCSSLTRDRAGASSWRYPRRSFDQCAGAGHRHRPARRLCDVRLSRHNRQHVAGSRTRRQKKEYRPDGRRGFFICA